MRQNLQGNLVISGGGMNDWRATAICNQHLREGGWSHQPSRLGCACWRTHRRWLRWIDDRRLDVEKDWQMQNRPLSQDEIGRYVGAIGEQGYLVLSEQWEMHSPLPCTTSSSNGRLRVKQWRKTCARQSYIREMRSPTHMWCQSNECRLTGQKTSPNLRQPSWSLVTT